MKKGFLTKALVAVGVMVSALALSSVCAFAAETTVATYTYGNTMSDAFGFEIKPGATNAACGDAIVKKSNIDNMPSFTDGTTLAHEANTDTTYWTYATSTSATMSSSITTNTGKKVMLVTPTVTGYMDLYFINVGSTSDKTSKPFTVYNAVASGENYTYSDKTHIFQADKMAGLTGNANYEPYHIPVTAEQPIVFYFNASKCCLAKAVLVQTDETPDVPVTAEITTTNSNSKAACAVVSNKFYAIAVIQATDIENSNNKKVVLSSANNSIETNTVYKSLKFPGIDTEYTAGDFGGNSTQYIYCVEVTDATAKTDVTAINVALSTEELSA